MVLCVLSWSKDSNHMEQLDILKLEDTGTNFLHDTDQPVQGRHPLPPLPPPPPRIIPGNPKSGMVNRGGGGGALTPHHGRYVPSQSQKWGGGGPPELARAWKLGVSGTISSIKIRVSGTNIGHSGTDGWMSGWHSVTGRGEVMNCKVQLVTAWTERNFEKDGLRNQQICCKICLAIKNGDAVRGTKLFYHICENDMHRDKNLGLKMGVSSVAHTYHAIHTECPPPPPQWWIISTVQSKECHVFWLHEIIIF